MDIETVAEVMSNCWDEPYDQVLATVQSYYAAGAVYNSETAEWEW